MATAPTPRSRLLKLLQMMRAQFLIGTLFPLLAGTIIAVYRTATFRQLGFLCAIGIGIGLHIATNVYNDIYDTQQHADETDASTRGSFSGGSGLLLNDPSLMAAMYRLARSGLLLSLVCFLLLLTQTDPHSWPFLVLIYGLTAFMSKYYTASPVKLGYRGLGELGVWFGFGPLAVSLGVLSQHTSVDAWMIPFLPLTGLTTLTIQWFGQLMDYEGDQAAGKRGLVLRLGPSVARYGYLILHLLILTNFLVIAWVLPKFWWTVIAVLVVYLILFPRLLIAVARDYASPQRLRAVSFYNAALYFLCSVLFVLGLAVVLFI